jgi:hypothetical protein
MTLSFVDQPHHGSEQDQKDVFHASSIYFLFEIRLA